MAVGHPILVIAYSLLRDGTDYQDLGPHSFAERDRRILERRLVRRLEALGYAVVLEYLQTRSAFSDQALDRYEERLTKLADELDDELAPPGSRMGGARRASVLQGDPVLPTKR